MGCGWVGGGLWCGTTTPSFGHPSTSTSLSINSGGEFREWVGCGWVCFFVTFFANPPLAPPRRGMFVVDGCGVISGFRLSPLLVLRCRILQPSPPTSNRACWWALHLAAAPTPTRAKQKKCAQAYCLGAFFVWK